MRIFSYSLTLFTFFLLTPALAAESVLLPKCDGEKCPSGYGLVPQEQTPPTSTQERPSSSAMGLTPSEKSASPIVQEQKQQAVFPDANSTSGRDATAVNINPGGTVSKEAVDEQKKMEDFLRAAGVAPQTPKIDDLNNPELKKYLEQKARDEIKPPLILDDNEFPGLEEEMASMLPNGFTVSVAPGYIWGAEDVALINEGLGYTQQQIPTNCQLRLDGSIASGEGLYSVKVYAGQRAMAKYEGIIKDVRFVPIAVCNQPRSPLPQKGSIIRRVGNKLSIQLVNWVNCGMPPRPPSSLEIQYTGDGQAQCKFN